MAVVLENQWAIITIVVVMLTHVQSFDCLLLKKLQIIFKV